MDAGTAFPLVCNFCLMGDWRLNRLVRPPAGYFLLAQKVPKDAQETDGFLTSFSAGK